MHRLLGIKPIYSFTRYVWFAFFLFNILDHICTTCFVFANLLENLFKVLFKNSQRYINKILRSIFKIWNFLPLFQMLFLWLNKTPLNQILLLVFKRVLDISFEEVVPIWNSIKSKITIWKIINWIKSFLNSKIWKLVVVRSFCFGLILSPPLAWIAKNRYLSEI